MLSLVLSPLLIADAHSYSSHSLFTHTHTHTHTHSLSLSLSLSLSPPFSLSCLSHPGQGYPGGAAAPGSGSSMHLAVFKAMLTFHSHVSLPHYLTSLSSLCPTTSIFSYKCLSSLSFAGCRCQGCRRGAAAPGQGSKWGGGRPVFYSYFIPMC